MVNSKLHLGNTIILLLCALVSYGQTRTSISNGSYNDPNTWDCNCVPGNSESIVITSGDSVLLAGNTTVLNVTIQSNAQLDNNNRRLSVNGNYTVDGQHTGAGDIRLLGTNSVIDGSGVISNGGDLDIRASGISINNAAYLTSSGGGDFLITGAITLTNNGYLICTNNIVGTNNNSTFLNAAGSTLEFSGRNLLSNRGILNASAIGNTVIYNRSGNQNIIDPSGSEYYNLTISGTNNKSLRANEIISNDLRLNGGSLRARNFSIDLKGNFINSGGLFDEGGGTVEFSGLADQYIIASQEEVFFNFRLNKSSGKLILNEDVSISGTLFMNAGVLDASLNVFSLGVSAATIGTLNRTGGQITGVFSRWMNTGTNAYLFPLGDGINYLPANLNFTSIADGRMNARFVPSFPGSSGLPIFDVTDSIRNTFNEGYWRFKDSVGLAGVVFNIDLTANNFSSYNINSSTRLIGRDNPSLNWTMVGSHVAASAPNVFRNAVAVLPIEFALGDTTKCTIPSPNTSPILGLSTVCKGLSASPYSVLITPGSTYSWLIDGGVQMTGGSSNTITVDWGLVGKQGSIQVIEYNGCEYGNPVVLPVDIQPVDPDQIIGQTVGYEGTNNNVYYVSEKAGYTYNWIVSGSATRSGAGSNDTIFVNFTTSGIAQIQFFYSNACGNSDTVAINVTVVTPIKSVASGNWTNINTWDCSCNPGNNSTVQILPTHTVTSTNNNERVYAVLIDSNATLNITGARLRVSNYFRNVGTVSGSGELRMDQSGSIIVGSGNWSGHSGLLNFQAGTHTISGGVNIIKSGDIQLNNTTTVFNDGSVATSGEMTGTASSTWEQKQNSTIRISNINWTNGAFIASALGNTVAYSGSGTFIRSIRFPLGGDYYNLEVNGNSLNGVYSINVGNINVLNDVNILGGTLDASASNFNINLTGNWNNAGGDFNERAGSVIFNGVNQSIYNPLRETFSELILNSSGIVNANCPLSIERDLIVSNLTTLDMNDPNDYELNLQADLFNNGSINFYENRLLFDGIALQNVNGNLSVYDVTLNNAAGLEIDAGMMSVRNTLDINSGQFNTKNNMTFVSDAIGTAKIADLTGGGSIIGDVIVQRYLNESNSAFWYMLGSPVSGSSLADWNNELYMGGFPGSNNPGWGPTVYSYENDSVPLNADYSFGYVAPSHISETLTPTRGWLVWVNSSPTTVDVIGPLNTGSISTGALSYSTNPTGGDSKRGWHLRSNPYASPVTWANVTKNNVSNGGEAYVSKPDGNYWSVNADNIDNIYSSEAFWIKVNSGGGSLTFDESDKFLGADSFNVRSVNTLSFHHPLKMSLTYARNATYSDYSVLRFGGDSNSVFFDNVYGEAYKVANAYGTPPNIASYDPQDSINIYYNTLNPNDSTYSIPLNIWKSYPQNRTENYKIEFEGIEEWNKSNHCLILSDSLNNYTGKLDANTNTYSWSANDAIADPYLFLNHHSPIQSSISNVSCFGYSDASIEAFGLYSTTSSNDYTWYNENGTVIQSDSNHIGSSMVQNLAVGKYRVEVSDNGFCGLMSQTFDVLEPEPVMADFSAPMEVPVNSSVNFSNQSVNAIFYEWNFGDGSTSTDTDPAHTFSSIGDYFVELKSIQSADCFDVQSKLISVKDYTGINELEAENIMIYSHSNQIYFTADFEKEENVKLYITDILGRPVLNKNYTNVIEIQDIISTYSLSGIYVVRIQSDSIFKSVKIFLD